MKKNAKRVQLDMSQETFEFLDALKVKTHSASRAEVVKNAIVYYNLLVNSSLNEDEIVLRDKEGSETKLVIPLVR